MHAETTFQTQTKMHANSQEDETQVLIHKKNNNLNCYLTLIDIKATSNARLLGRLVCQHRVLMDYKSWTDEWILMILTHMINIDEKFQIDKGQGHKIEGQGQICNNVKNLKKW